MRIRSNTSNCAQFVSQGWESALASFVNGQVPSKRLVEGRRGQQRACGVDDVRPQGLRGRRDLGRDGLASIDDRDKVL